MENDLLGAKDKTKPGKKGTPKTPDEIDMDDVFQQLAEQYKKLAKPDFTNKAYMIGKSRMSAAGASAKDAKEYGQTQRGKANELWKKLHGIEEGAPKVAKRKSDGLKGAPKVAKHKAAPKKKATKISKTPAVIRKRVQETSSKSPKASKKDAKTVSIKKVLERIGNYSSKESFTSSAFHTARRLAIDAGFADEPAKEIGRAKCKQAGRYWDSQC